MSTLYALVAGIDTYRAVTGLRGCRNDAEAAAAYLRTRTGGGDTLALAELYDDKATRAAIIGGLRGHLRRAGPGDTALFWFAGHGSQAPVPRELWHLEPSGWMQTLVCADSRQAGVPDLYDKELSLLLDQVAATGCHVAVVLDSCHSAGATRGEMPEAVARTRAVPPAETAPRADQLLPELRDGAAALPVQTRHVLLAACRSAELAQEMPDGAGVPRGIFSWSLLRALGRLGPAATYRELLTAARCTVEDRVSFQVPQLFPATDGPADRPFLGGRLTPPASGMVMRYVHGGWEMDAGSCHGLPASDGLTVAVAEEKPVRSARVTVVRTERSALEPIGWAPDRDRQYPVVLTGLPLPRTTVRVGGPGDDPGTTALILAAMAGSPHVRPLDAAEDQIPDLRVRVPDRGYARLLGSDATVLTTVADDDPEECARRTVRACEHIARWRQVKALTNPMSGLTGAVRVGIVEARPGERTAPLDRPRLVPDEDGLIRLRYQPAGAGWVAPEVFIRLRNTTNRSLYCVLLDLTGRYRIHAGLFPGDHLGAGRSGAALDGRPVRFSLPAGDEPRPGAQIRDWLQLVVAEDEFSGRPFELSTLRPDRPPVIGRGPMGLGGILDRLGRIAVHRDAGGAEPDGAYDWATTVVPVVTEVPR